MKRNSLSRSALARTTGVDRSTIAQLLSEDETRLPNAHLAAECAVALGVSVDWLLALTERSETTADLLDASFRMTEADRTPTDAQIDEWHRESAGYKIRHVPATLPDILKTDAVIGFEYARFLDKTPEQAVAAVRDKAKWLHRPGSDYEICVSREWVESLSRGEGYWRGLPKAARREQIEYMAEKCRNLYPSLRMYLYDSKVVFSSPLTIFGPLVAVVYIGRYYMAFRENRQIQALTNHFDQLVRDSETDARSVADIIEQMPSTT
ncbi:helix-turn-helix transcriptional regulator [Magnetospira sp. QH-2]|uniref:helix-turn-helix transcriptional regulator n=1 Tax=Magnetospira sp. (strain QH-2) TaxID=1288970 RepID=UPI0018E0B155|nr:helix-turn-helix transcriptional regulator [Magnetospira sp. QH-2]